jgi:hypothetical protein
VLTIPTLVLNFVAELQKLEVPETVNPSTEDTTSSWELTSAPYLLEDNAQDQQYSYGHFWIYSCPKPSSFLNIHRIITECISAIPENIPASFDATSTELKNRDGGDVYKRQYSWVDGCSVIYIPVLEAGEFGWSNSARSSLSIPRIFSLPTLFINLVRQFSSVSARTLPGPQSLAASNFDLVRKSVDESLGALNIWVENEKRQLPTCRPGQPPNIPCKNAASRFSTLPLLLIPLLALGVMVCL